MAALSSVDYAAGVLSSQTTGTVMTINAVAAVAGTPAAFAMTVQPSSINFSITAASNSVFKITSIDGTNATNIKTTSARLFGAALFNNGSSTIFLKMYNSSVAPTAGSSQFFLNIGVPPGAYINPKFTAILSSLGLGYTITGAIASTDTTVISSNDLIGSIEYA